MSKLFALIIEDADELGELFGDILMASGLDAEVIGDGREAMDWLKEKTPDLVVLDVHLPNVSGMEILDYIRGEERLKKIKVVVVTAAVLMLKDVEEKADLTLIKPVSFTQIRDLTSRLLQKKEEATASANDAHPALAQEQAETLAPDTVEATISEDGVLQMKDQGETSA
jgi:DNA-binding response OmpR family regulator